MKAGIPLDFDKLLCEDDGHPPELIILGAAEKSKPQVQMESNGEEVEWKMENNVRRSSDKDLIEQIKRSTSFLKNHPLCDGGEKLRTSLVAWEAEADRRGLYKDDDKCKRAKTLAEESTCTGLTNDLSHPGAPPLKPGSDFALLFCKRIDNDNKMENYKATKCSREDLHTLNQSDPRNIREHKPISPPIIKQKKGLSSRQAPFKSPNHLSVNIDGRKRNYGEQLGIHTYNTSPHPPDKDASCCLTKKHDTQIVPILNLKDLRVTNTVRLGQILSAITSYEDLGPFKWKGVARSQLPLNSRRNNKTVVLDLVDEEELEEVEELEVDVINKVDQVDQSKNTRICYPSRDDPVAIEICYSDMECLDPESNLSSHIMNFYVRYLQKPTSPSARRKHDYHIFNTYFYEKLKQYVLTKTDTKASFLNLRRWWKDVNLFEKAYIFLPIHENVHWSLVIICMPDKEDGLEPIILHLDSLGLHISKSIFRNVKSFLIEEWNYVRQKMGLTEPPLADSIWNRLNRRITEKVIEVPQQKNEYDCGLFVLYSMQLFIEEAPERLKKQNLEMFGRHWFKPEEASSLRKKIRNLLREEFKNANENTCKVPSQS